METVKKQDVYATVDQRLLGDDQFVDRVATEYGKPVKKERRKREYELPRLARAVAQAGGITAEDLRGSGRQREIVQGRATFVVLAKSYGYRGLEIATYLRKDPTAVTQYARKADEGYAYIDAAEKLLGAERK